MSLQINRYGKLQSAIKNGAATEFQRLMTQQGADPYYVHDDHFGVGKKSALEYAVQLKRHDIVGLILTERPPGEAQQSILTRCVEQAWYAGDERSLALLRQYVPAEHLPTQSKQDTLDELFEALAMRDSAKAAFILQKHPALIDEPWFHPKWSTKRAVFDSEVRKRTPAAFLLSPDCHFSKNEGVEWVKGNADMLRAILPFVRDFSADGPNHAVLTLAAFYLPETVPDLLKAGAPHDVSGMVWSDWSPLDAALMEPGGEVAAEALLKAGSNPNQRLTVAYEKTMVNMVMTPLGHVIEANQGHPYRQQWLVKLLLDHGADPSLPDAQGKRPLDYAMEQGLPASDTVRTLIRRGASLTTPHYSDELLPLDYWRKVHKDSWGKTAHITSFGTTQSQQEYLSRTLDETAQAKLAALLITKDGAPSGFTYKLIGMDMLGAAFDETRWRGHGAKGITLLERLTNALPEWAKPVARRIDHVPLRREAQDEPLPEHEADDSFAGRFGRERGGRAR